MDSKVVPVSALKWLFGEEGDFECPPELYFRGKPAPYWWRSVFRKMIDAAPPVEGGEAVAWMISDPAGDLATVVTLRPQDPVSKAGLVITPLYTRPADSEALLLRCRTVLASWGDEIGDATALAAEIDEYLKGRT